MLSKLKNLVVALFAASKRGSDERVERTVFTVKVPGGLSLLERARRARLLKETTCNCGPQLHTFPADPRYQEVGETEVTLGTILIENLDKSHEEVLAEIDRQGYEAAGPEELIALVVQYPSATHGGRSILALGVTGRKDDLSGWGRDEDCVAYVAEVAWTDDEHVNFIELERVRGNGNHKSYGWLNLGISDSRTTSEGKVLVRRKAT